MKTTDSRPALRTGLVAAALLTLAACGGIADDAPTDADETEFCQAYYDEESSAQDVADDLARIGTPEGITDDQRNGFEVYVDGLADEGDTPNKDVDTVQIPADDQGDGTAFVNYARDLCSPLLNPTDPAAPTDPASPSQAPSGSTTPSGSATP